jgi:hypothetical protein
VTAIATTDELRQRLPRVALLGSLQEQPVWRAHDFARYEVGTLPDGRPQWLEFWLRNHLLDDFANLKKRAEVGIYGGEPVAFLGLQDLLRSKETERESDWQDITLLEEILDDRNRARISSAPEAEINYLSSLRSRRGMDFAVKGQLTAKRQIILSALALCKHPVTCAFLHDFVNDQPWPALAAPVSAELRSLLSSAVPASPRHFTLIEIVRRNYKRVAMERDRADKQSLLGKQ